MVDSHSLMKDLFRIYTLARVSHLRTRHVVLGDTCREAGRTLGAVLFRGERGYRGRVPEPPDRGPARALGQN